MPSGSVSGERNPIRTVPGCDRRDLVRGRPRHPDDRVGALEQAPRLAQRRARLGVALVGEAGGRSGAALDHDLEPAGDQPADGFGHERHPALAGGSLTGNGDAHPRNLREGIWGRGRNPTYRELGSPIFTAAMSACDPSLEGHASRVGVHAEAVARRLGWTGRRRSRICGSAPRCTTSAR